MGNGLPRTLLSVLAALTVFLPAVFLLATPSQAQVTCNTASQTNQTFPDLVVSSLVVQRVDPTITITKSGNWVFISQPGFIEIQLKVRNAGTAPTTNGDGAGDGSFIVKLEDVRPDGNTQLIETRSVPNLAAGGESSLMRIGIENYNGTGEHKLVATADSTNRINEKCVSQVPNDSVDRETNNVLEQRVLLTAKPDLRVTSIVAKSEVKAFATKTAASKIFFNATISNAGNHRAFNAENEASGFLALFKLNNDENACKHTANTVTVKEVPAGGAKQVEVKCEIGQLTGDFNVSVDIDSANKVVESNEANNRFLRVFHLRIADLESNVTGVTGTTEEGAVPEFGQMTFTATVRNRGDANASTDDNKRFDWFVYLDEKKDNPTNLLGNFSTMLSPGASTSATFTIKPLDRNLAIGAHKIFVVADSDRAGDTSKGKVIESETANNTFEFNFTVAHFELNLTAGNVTKRVSPGIEVRYPFNLTNEGNAKDEVALSVTGAAVTTRIETDNGTAVTGRVDVPENESVPLVLVVQVPRDAAENSSLNLTVKAESTVPRANAVDTLAFRTSVGPDVVAPTIEKVKPTGTIVGATGDIELRITDNVAVTSVSYAIDGGTANPLAAAAGSPDTYRVPRPGDQGDFTLVVTARDAKGNQASRTFNLAVDTAPPVIRSIAVVEEAARDPRGINPGAAITVTAEIDDANMKNATVRVGAVEAPMAKKGGNVWESVGLKAPATPGQYRPVVYAFDQGENSARQVEDLDLVHVRGVDLALAAQVTGSPSNPREGDTVTIRVTVLNAGLAPAQGVNVQLLIDGEAVDERSVTIAAGGSESVALEWEAEAGVHRFDVLVDPANEFQETSELNNQLFQGQDASIATIFPKARVFTKEAAENDLPDLLARYLWVLLLGLAALAVGAAAFFVKPA